MCVFSTVVCCRVLCLRRQANIALVGSFGAPPLPFLDTCTWQSFTFDIPTTSLYCLSVKLLHIAHRHNIQRGVQQNKLMNTSADMSQWGGCSGYRPIHRKGKWYYLLAVAYQLHRCIHFYYGSRIIPTLIVLQLQETYRSTGPFLQSEHILSVFVKCATGLQIMKTMSEWQQFNEIPMGIGERKLKGQRPRFTYCLWNNYHKM